MMSKSSELKSVIWAAFWLYILTLGDPDLVSAVIEWIGRH